MIIHANNYTEWESVATRFDYLCHHSKCNFKPFFLRHMIRSRDYWFPVNLVFSMDDLLIMPNKWMVGSDHWGGPTYAHNPPIDKYAFRFFKTSRQEELKK